MSFLQPQKPRSKFNVQDWNDQIAESRKRKEEQKRLQEEIERKEDERVRRELEELQQKYEQEIQQERRMDQMQLPQLKGKGGGAVAMVQRDCKISKRGEPAKDFPFSGDWEHKVVSKKRVKRSPLASSAENQEHLFHSRPQEKKHSPIHNRSPLGMGTQPQPHNSPFGLPSQPPDFKKEVEDIRQIFQKENGKLKQQLNELKYETDNLKSQLESRRAAAERELHLMQEDIEYYREEAERWKYTAEKYAKKVEFLQKNQRKTMKISNAPVGELRCESIYVPVSTKISFANDLKELVDEAATESSQSMG